MTSTGGDGIGSVREEALLPLFKWAGGKRFLVPELTKHVPASYRRYFEPFFGSGALFLALRPKAAVISDKNTELMATYEQLRDNPDRIITRLQRMKNESDEYYRIRKSRPTSDSGKAARFIYLANFAFNGIYRVNLNGEFNVPYGHNDDHPLRRVVNGKHIRAVSVALAGATITSGDFEAAVAEAGDGDFVYLDPPYTVAHGQNGFIKYNAKIFSWEDQVRVATVAATLRDKGCHVVISNAYHKSIRQTFGNFERRRIRRHSIMSADKAHRRRINEYILTASPLVSE